jgi:hypothetical protein
MKAGSRKGVRRKKKRWLRRLYWTVFVILVIAVVAVAVLVANLKKIVLSQLQSSFPGLRISVDNVSLESLSRVRVAGLRFAGAREQKGSVLFIPEIYVRYRFDPFNGLRFRSMDLQRPQAILRPGIGAVISSLGAPAKKVEGAARFPRGPRVGRISLSNSRLDFSAPDVRLMCSLDALADSPVTGVLLDQTNVSFQSSNVSLSLSDCRLRDLDWRLSAFITRQPGGKRIDVLQGELSAARILDFGFRGSLRLEEFGLAAAWQIEVKPFELSDVRDRLQEVFPELKTYRISGALGARLGFLYESGERPNLAVSGEISLRTGQAVIPIPEPLVVEGLEADLPVQGSLLAPSASLYFGAKDQSVAGGTVAARQIIYEDEELASNLLTFFEVQAETQGVYSVKALRVSLDSHGGRIYGNVSGTLRNDGVALEGTMSFREVALEEVFHRLGGERYLLWGQVSGRALVTCDSAPKKPFLVKGTSSFRVPEAILGLAKKPLTITGLEVNAPFEYSVAANVHSFGISKGDTHPLGGTVTAEKIGYGERTAPDGTSVPQWSASGLWATLVSSGEALELTVRSCRAYDGEITGSVKAELGKERLTCTGDFRLQDLDLERLSKGLGVKKEKFYISGLMEGDVSIACKEGTWDEFRGKFSATHPGGIIRVEDVEKLLDSIPGQAGKATLQALKTRLSPKQWSSFVEALKEFRYRVATVDVAYRPLPAGAGTGLRARLELHRVGSGAGQTFDITIPITWDVI